MNQSQRTITLEELGYNDSQIALLRSVLKSEINSVAGITADIETVPNNSTQNGVVLTLGAVIEYLRTQDQTKIVPMGLGEVSAFRWCCEIVAFSPVKNIKVSEMLTNAEAAVGEVFEGYKGGLHRMSLTSPCHLAGYACDGEPITLGLLDDLCQQNVVGL